MLKKNSLLILLTLAFVSCKKQIPNTIDPDDKTKPIIKIDTNILSGYWIGVKNPNTSKAIYFDANHSGLALWNGTAGDALINWRFSNDSTLQSLGGLFPLKKLTRDSLVFEVDKKISRYFRVATPSTPYLISTIIPSMEYSPNSLTSDSEGNIYITQTFGILKVLKNTSNSSRWVDDILNPLGLAIDPSGDLLYCAGSYLKKVDKLSKAVTTLMSPGKPVIDNVPYKESSLGNPKEIAVDHEGNIYVVDEARVRMIEKKTGMIKTIIGAKDYTGQKFNPSPISALDIWLAPTKLSVDKDANLYICDGINNCIWKYNLDGKIRVIAGDGKQGYSGDGDIGTNAQLNYPSGVAVDDLGNVFISDIGNAVIRKLSSSDNKISTIAGYGKQTGHGPDYYNARISGLGGLGSLAAKANGDIIFIQNGGLLFGAGPKKIRKLTLNN